ncbi:MAG TPA: anti-sigma factor [Candidatus Dormibacteraeota bacterium]
MSDHEQLEGSVAAWVLGALEPAEAGAIRSHVEACPTCREVAGRLRRVVGALPLAVEESVPPPRLRERVLAAAAASSRPSSAEAAVRKSRPQPGAPRLSAPPLVQFGRRIPVYAVAAVAVVALLAGFLVGQVALRGPQPPAPSQVARFTMSGQQGMSGAQANVIDLKADGLALVDFRGLPQPGPGRVYEVWLIPKAGNPVSVAVFVPDGNGGKVVLVNRSLAGYTVMAVTNEPGPDGSASPTQQPQLYGNVA